MANKSVEDIQGFAQDLLKLVGADVGIAAVEEERTIAFVADLDKQLHDEFYGRRITLPEDRKSHYGTDAVAGSQLAADVTAGSLTFTIDDSAALATTGAGIIYDGNGFDLFTHTGNAAGTVSGVPATGPGSINFDHDEDLAVERLYALPSDFGRMRPVKKHAYSFQDHDGVTVDGAGYFSVPETPTGRTFATFQDTSGNWFLWLPRGTSGQIQVTYDLAPNTIDALASEISFQAPYHLYHVWGLVGLYKQALDEDYVPQKERAEMDRVVNAMLAKRSAGKRLTAGSVFFGRMRL